MEREHTERTFEIDRVVVALYSDRHSQFDLYDVEEIMYAERFVLIAHRDGEGAMVRRTFPYERIVSMTTVMKPDMPVIVGDDEDVQDEEPEIYHFGTLRGDVSVRHTTGLHQPSESAAEMLRGLGITVKDDD